MTSRGTHVGKPVRSRSTGVMVIPLSRRIDRPDGSFGGVVLVTLDLGFFGRFYDRFDVGREAPSCSPRRRHPDLPAPVQRKPGRHGHQQGLAVPGAGAHRPGRHRDADAEDRRHRAPVQLPPPATAIRCSVASAESKDEILGAGGCDVLRTSCIVAFAIAMLAWGGARMIRQIRIREKLEDELRRAGAALQRHNLSLKTLAESDGLTGLANRRLFEDDPRARARARAAQRRAVRADHGRRRCLQEVQRPLRPRGRRRLPAPVAAAIASVPRRPGDLAARYGGEEFAVILPDTELEGAQAVAEAIRAAVAALRIEHADSPIGRVSLSLGW